jgi:hypothetical protein
VRLLSAKNEEYPEESQQDRGSPKWQRRYLATCRGPLDHSIVLRVKGLSEKPRFSKI